MFYPSGYYRAKARAALKGRWQTALLIALVVNLPTLLVQGISVFTGNDLLDRMQAFIVASSRDGVLSRDLLVTEMETFVSSTPFLVCRGLDVLAWLITPVLSLGMYRWLLNILRGGVPGPVSDVFSCSRQFFRAIGLQLLIVLKVLLWMLPGLALGVASMIPLYRAVGTEAQLAAMGTVNTFTLPVLAVTLIPGVMAALRYALSEYVLANEPKTRILVCIRRSKELMKEQKKSLFFLLFSFLLWYLLELLVASFLSGIGSGVLALVCQMLASLALNVYISASIVSFYLRLSEGPSSAPAGEESSNPEELN